MAPDTVRPRAPGDTTRAPLPGDSLRRAPGDSAKPKELVTWFASDSVYEALIARPGYRPVRYQGDTVVFQAKDRILTLLGTPAAIERDETLLVGHTVIYNDSSQFVVAIPTRTGIDSVVLRDPSQGSDLVVRDTITYDLATGRGKISLFSTSVQQGETWKVSGQRGIVLTDTTAAGGRVFYVHNGSITSCTDTVPHYHFQARDIKYIQKNLLVIRPAVMYIADVPVLWLPFVFQDTRSGRRSGILSPRFGIAELVRNNANYHRSLENLGYYFNLGDYADAQGWMDWRSGGRGDTFDPGYTRFNLETRYSVIDRFLRGRLSASYTAQRNGSRNTAISFAHEQSFNQQRRLSANLNWVQNTTVQRQNSINPAQALGTISSQLNLQDKYGPFSVSLGGSRTQYPGRKLVDQDFPTVSVSSRTISVRPWLDWTPTASFSNRQNFNIDQGIQFDTVFTVGPNGTVLTKGTKASRRNTSASFDTPLKIFDFQWQNSFRFSEDVQDYPQSRVVFRDVRDSTTRETRIFNQAYTSNVYWQTSFSLPRFLQGTWNVSPTVSLATVDSRYGLLFRSELSGGQWVSQTLRPSFGLSASPTVYAFPPGFGPVERFRHSIQPSISFSYSPQQTVSDQFLRAAGLGRQGYLGALSQSRVSLGVTTNLEAKLRAKATDDTTSQSIAAEGRKVRLLTVNFTPLTYDFKIADSVGGSFFNKRGITDQTFGYSVRSDLVPGLDLRTNYSLFLGAPSSDTAVFKPYLTDINASFSLNQKSALFGFIGRLFGIRPEPEPRNAPGTPTTPNGSPRGGDEFFSRQAQAQQVAGSNPRNVQFEQPPNQPWQASFTFTSARQRPDIRGTLIRIDPTVTCNALLQSGSQIAYDLCLARAQIAPPAGLDSTGVTTQGGAVFYSPPTKSITANTTFHLTPKWGATWSTSYDLVRANFASNVVSLQRELHDWRAVFAFTQSPNGNFAFNFFVALKAEPDLKFDYSRPTYRANSVVR